MRILIWLPVPVVLIILVGCSKTPRLTEYDDQTNNQARLAPLVVVASTESDALIGRPVPSRKDPNYPMQLHRVKLRIENFLKGAIGEKTIYAYYFGFGGGVTGPRPLGFRIPSRRILWLRRESGSYRMACDGRDNCTLLVRSGSHPG